MDRQLRNQIGFLKTENPFNTHIMDADKASRLLPWNNQELEDLMKDLVAHGTEAGKADYKSELELATAEQKADVLKDVMRLHGFSAGFLP